MHSHDAARHYMSLGSGGVPCSVQWPVVVQDVNLVVVTDNVCQGFLICLETLYVCSADGLDANVPWCQVNNVLQCCREECLIRYDALADNIAEVTACVYVSCLAGV